MTNTCPRCNQINPPDARFCSNCANPFGAPEPAPQHKFAMTSGVKALLVVLGGLCLLSLLCVVSPMLSGDSGRRAALNSSTPAASPAPTSDDDTTDFQTPTSRRMLAGFFIKPVLRQMLNDPDSLQDLEVIRVTPIEKKPPTFEAVVSYRAKNSFGALVTQQQTFIITRGTGNGLDAWKVLPMRN